MFLLLQLITQSGYGALSNTMLAQSFYSFRHMKEIAELQTQQKNEIEALYIRLGKPLPPNLGFLHSAPPSGRRRRTSKNKLKAGKLLNPLVQQLRSGTSSTSRYTGCFPSPVACLSRGCAVWCVGFLERMEFLSVLSWHAFGQACPRSWWQAIPACSALPTVLGRGIIFHFNLENSLITSPPFFKCNLLMFVFTS